jgi:hypothetical protein
MPSAPMPSAPMMIGEGGGEGEGGGGEGGGGEGGGGGGEGGGGGDGGQRDGYLHTRQPVEVTLESENHSIVPGPKMKLEGPLLLYPEKLVNVPHGWLGMRRES